MHFLWFFLKGFFPLLPLDLLKLVAILAEVKTFYIYISPDPAKVGPTLRVIIAVSYTHLTLPTNREV